MQNVAKFVKIAGIAVPPGNDYIQTLLLEQFHARSEVGCCENLYAVFFQQSLDLVPKLRSFINDQGRPYWLRL
ncbi:MAG: hypothetical protein ACX933_06910 [Marinobacter adhaerens]